MMEISRKIPSDHDEDSQAKCRIRRRRRIEMRRLALANPSLYAQHRKEMRMENFGFEKKRVRKIEDDVKATSSLLRKDVKPLLYMPQVGFGMMFGMISVTGRSRDMEDVVSSTTWHIGPENSRRRALHFFAVFDGHGGSHVSAICGEKMHEFMREELARVLTTRGDLDGGAAAVEEETTWRRVMRRSFERMDELAFITCACGSVGGKCACHPMQVALCGSTAVVAVLTPHHLIVANCGDSRAVLSRGGRTIPLSDDHKPDRIDELARIKKAGGRVICVNGARVEGILAMSRAIGDKYLKPAVISEPEITFTRRKSDDECLILGSDGLWDVITNEMACEVARECLQGVASASTSTIDLNAVPRLEAEVAGTFFPTQSTLAAALLTRLALGRKSLDNISVIVVDLKRISCSSV